MRILYGVQGTGNGHIARARVMAKALAQREDIQVDYVFTGRNAEDYFDMEVFGDYKTFEGLTFVTQNGEVNRWETVKRIKFKQFIKDVKNLQIGNYDLLLNDFDPVTAWAAKLNDLASISVSHQAAFKHPVPKQGESFADRILMHLFAPCEINLGVHWYHFGYPILPPFIEESISQAKSGDKVLVYLPFENLDEIKSLLKALPRVEFECYHPDIKKPYHSNNTHWRCLSKADFRESLFNCAGVIANGGFELSSECLTLGKKILIKPLKNQYEQASNCITLEKMGRCSSMHELDVDAVKQWLNVASPEPINYPNNPDVFIDWLLEEDWLDTKSLCQQLWKHIRFPDNVLSSLQNPSYSSHP